MVGPGRRRQQHALGAAFAQQIAAKPQRAGAADRLDRNEVARHLAEREFADQLQKLHVALLADIGLGLLRREQARSASFTAFITGVLPLASR